MDVIDKGDNGALTVEVPDTPQDHQIPEEPVWIQSTF